MRRRVVITGLSCITPLGSDTNEVWQRLLDGQSGVGHISLFDASSFPVRIAAEVSDWELSSEIRELLPKSFPRQSQFAVTAGLRAWRESGLEFNDHLQCNRVGMSLGCGEIFPDFDPFIGALAHSFDGDRFEFEKFLRQYPEIVDTGEEISMEPGAPIGVLAGQLGIEGPANNYTTACASSSIAIGEAVESIRRNETDAMLAGGAHSMIHPLGITGFHRLSVLSGHNGDPTTASRPFDQTRDGFVVGEGCVVFILEELEHAKRRDAKIWAEITGYGSTHDAFRYTDMRPDGSAAIRSIKLALDQAAVEPSQIGYINAHGSGTPSNDVVETSVIRKSFGSAADNVAISSTKSMTGHLTTACGAIETMVSMLAVCDNAAPPTINYHQPDPQCDLDYVPNEARSINCQHALNVNFGFGGNNVALVVSEFVD